MEKAAPHKLQSHLRARLFVGTRAISNNGSALWNCLETLVYFGYQHARGARQHGVHRSALFRTTGIHEGETTADGKVTLRTAECLASCGTAPMMQVDKEYFENLTPERVEEILKRLQESCGDR